MILSLPHADARADLQTMLRRASAYGDGSVRLAAHGSLLVVTVPVSAPNGLLDLGPTILGMRAVRMSSEASFDSVVPIAAIAEALGEDADMQVPAAGVGIPAWAAVSPPQSGWSPVGEVSAESAGAEAAAAVAEIAAALPESPGEAVLRRTRRSVWSRGADGLPQLTLGAAVALDALGFLRPGTSVRVTSAGAWTRASTVLGDVVVRG